MTLLLTSFQSGHGPFSLGDLHANVSSIITSRSWDLDKLNYPLPDDVTNRILCIPLSKYNPKQDFIVWTSSNGNFSCESAYDRITLIVPREPDLEWVRKLKILLRIKTFIWLLCLNKLPTRSSLYSKHLIFDALCNSCFEEETERHIIWECPHSKLFWKELGITHKPFTQNYCTTSWLKSNARSKRMVHSTPSGLIFLSDC
ncbi:hypothetical protein LIER_41427 [Lithospermum erythrorhizon]|uniref:Reverse transcriptase zinc-binding domain-containing protein n=1 Tax=Lithospermum erythrorhizon TaxID=34254 RepID=A0AAV3RAP8_LITER